MARDSPWTEIEGLVIKGQPCCGASLNAMSLDVKRFKTECKTGLYD